MLHSDQQRSKKSYLDYLCSILALFKHLKGLYVKVIYSWSKREKELQHIIMQKAKNSVQSSSPKDQLKPT